MKKILALIASILFVFLVYWQDVENPFDLTVSRFDDIEIKASGVWGYVSPALKGKVGEFVITKKVVFIPMGKIHKIVKK